MRDRTVRLLQIASITFIWLFVSSVAFWIIHLLRVALRLHDSLNASVAIGIVAVPVFFTIASVLTYVFVGLQRAEDHGREERK